VRSGVRSKQVQLSRIWHIDRRPPDNRILWRAHRAALIVYIAAFAVSVSSVSFACRCANAFHAMLLGARVANVHGERMVMHSIPCLWGLRAA
jgi:hypothetical protein